MFTVRSLSTAVALTSTAVLFAATPALGDPVSPAFPGSKLCFKHDVPGVAMAYDLRVRNGTCAKAKSAARKFRYTRWGGKLPGWRCRRVASRYEGAYYRCNKARTTIQFYHGV